MANFEPRIVCFSCKFGWGYLGDEMELAASIDNWIPVICSGKIDPENVLEAFSRGIDGVLILGCAEGDCHYQDGNYEAKKRIQLLKTVLTAYGIEPERVSMQFGLDPEGKKIPEYVKALKSQLSKLGPLNRKVPA